MVDRIDRRKLETLVAANEKAAGDALHEANEMLADAKQAVKAAKEYEATAKDAVKAANAAHDRAANLALFVLGGN
jgi:hypothetical protein